MAPTRQRRSEHNPGRVLRDLAVVLADGGNSLSDLAVIRNQPDLFGGVASDPTAWRVVASVDGGRLAALQRARATLALVRGKRGWRQKGELVLDFDATL